MITLFNKSILFYKWGAYSTASTKLRLKKKKNQKKYMKLNVQPKKLKNKFEDWITKYKNIKVRYNNYNNNLK